MLQINSSKQRQNFPIRKKEKDGKFDGNISTQCSEFSPLRCTVDRIHGTNRLENQSDHACCWRRTHRSRPNMTPRHQRPGSSPGTRAHPPRGGGSSHSWARRLLIGPREQSTIAQPVTTRHVSPEEPAPRKAVARDLAKLRAMGLVAGDAAKERVLSVSPLTFLGFISRFCLEIWLRNLGEPRSVDLF